MVRVDRSFEGLLFSLGIHAILVWILIHIPNLPPSAQSGKTEVTLIEEPAKPKSKAHNFIEETQTKPKEIKDLTEAADFLSQFTKRVKKQLTARQLGPVRNSTPSPISTESKGQNSGKRSGVAGMTERTEQDKKRGDIGMPAPGGNEAPLHASIGPSSITQFVPGVEHGEFTSLNTDQFTYYSFFARINEQIRNRWTAGIREYAGRLSVRELEELSKVDRTTVFEVILTKEGEYSSYVVSHTSGDRGLDQTSVQSVISAAPFINPPQGMIESDGFIHLYYQFTILMRPPLGQAGY